LERTLFFSYFWVKSHIAAFELLLSQVRLCLACVRRIRSGRSLPILAKRTQNIGSIFSQVLTFERVGRRIISAEKGGVYPVVCDDPMHQESSCGPPTDALALSRGHFSTFQKQLALA